MFSSRTIASAVRSHCHWYGSPPWTTFFGNPWLENSTRGLPWAPASSTPRRIRPAAALMKPGSVG